MDVGRLLGHRDARHMVTGHHDIEPGTRHQLRHDEGAGADVSLLQHRLGQVHRGGDRSLEFGRMAAEYAHDDGVRILEVRRNADGDLRATSDRATQLPQAEPLGQDEHGGTRVDVLHHDRARAGDERLDDLRHAVRGDRHDDPGGGVAPVVAQSLDHREALARHQSQRADVEVLVGAGRLHLERVGPVDAQPHGGPGHQAVQTQQRRPRARFGADRGGRQPVARGLGGFLLALLCLATPVGLIHPPGELLAGAQRVDAQPAALRVQRPADRRAVVALEEEVGARLPAVHDQQSLALAQRLLEHDLG